MGAQMYSSTRDMAKLASVFMVGQGESKNALGIYSSSLREMMTPSFVNDDRVRPFSSGAQESLTANDRRTPDDSIRISV
jgi:hypothetical protein